MNEADKVAYTVGWNAFSVRYTYFYNNPYTTYDLAAAWEDGWEDARKDYCDAEY